MLKIIEDDFIESVNGKLDVDEILYYIRNYENIKSANKPLVINHPSMMIELNEEDCYIVEPFELKGILPNIMEYVDSSFILISALDPFLLVDGNKKLGKELADNIEAMLINIDDIHMDIFMTLSSEVIEANGNLFKKYLD